MSTFTCLSAWKMTQRLPVSLYYRFRAFLNAPKHRTAIFSFWKWRLNTKSFPSSNQNKSVLRRCWKVIEPAKTRAYEIWFVVGTRCDFRVRSWYGQNAENVFKCAILFTNFTPEYYHSEPESSTCIQHNLCFSLQCSINSVHSYCEQNHSAHKQTIWLHTKCSDGYYNVYSTLVL